MEDDRRVIRLVVDVLATEAQAVALQDVIGEAICGAPGLHDGPCRIAWTAAFTVGRPDDDDEVSYGLDRAEIDFIREHLAPVDVWMREAVDRSLDLSLSADTTPRQQD